MRVIASESSLSLPYVPPALVDRCKRAAHVEALPDGDTYFAGLVAAAAVRAEEWTTAIWFKLRSNQSARPAVTAVELPAWHDPSEAVAPIPTRSRSVGATVTRLEVWSGGGWLARDVDRVPGGVRLAAGCTWRLTATAPGVQAVPDGLLEGIARLVAFTWAHRPERAADGGPPVALAGAVTRSGADGFWRPYMGTWT